MKKTVFYLCAALVFSSCATESEMPEITMENGVEVVLNRLEPYTLEGEPSTFTLEKEFSIDTENEAIAQLGLTDIGTHFAIDSEANIYLTSYENAEGMILKFDSRGNFVRSFLRKGQGPGELEGRNYLSLNPAVDRHDNIAFSDFGNKLVVFDSDGNLIEERKTDSSTVSTSPLPNGNFLSFISVMDGRSEFINQNPLCLLDSQFDKIKELDKQMVPNPIVGKRLKGIYYILSWSVSDSLIFTGFQERGYTISAYDFDGNLVRKIKKEWKPVTVPEEHKKKFMRDFSAPLFDDIRSKIYFPDAMPPFHSFFADDKGRLFVMTYEKGENPGEILFDIFNPGGICIGRKGLKILHDESGVYAKMKNGRFYCLDEKESGYKELIVAKVIWE